MNATENRQRWSSCFSLARPLFHERSQAGLDIPNSLCSDFKYSSVSVAFFTKLPAFIDGISSLGESLRQIDVELQLLDRLYYKNKNQHRSSPVFRKFSEVAFQFLLVNTNYPAYYIDKKKSIQMIFHCVVVCDRHPVPELDFRAQKPPPHLFLVVSLTGCQR
jgi:hypothetical protein